MRESCVVTAAVSRARDFAARPRRGASTAHLGLALVVLCLASGVAAAALTRSQQACIVAMNAGLLKVESVAAKSFAACIDRKAAGATEATVRSCLADQGAAIGKVSAGLESQYRSKCDGVDRDGVAMRPTFGVTSGSSVSVAAEAATQALLIDLLGEDMDTAVILRVASALGAKCQRGVVKSVFKCQQTWTKGFNDCKKTDLATGTIGDAAGLAACLQPARSKNVPKACDFTIGSGSAKPKPGGIRKALTQQCKGVDLQTAVPACPAGTLEELHACIRSRAACRVCQAANRADALGHDCDGFDDGLANGSCIALGRVPVAITAPDNLTLLSVDGVRVAGTVGDPTATVEVNEVPAAVVAGDPSTFAVDLALHEGTNIITATATDRLGNVGTSSISVTVDTQAPRVTIDSPAAGLITTAATIDVSGAVNDTVVGTVNPGNASVTVNGVTATVANRSYLASAVPLALGENTIVATATDRAGHASSPATITVARAEPAGLAHIREVGGNGQVGAIGSVLAQPLAVELVDATGAPAVGETVVFRVKENNGTLSDGATSARALAKTTDANGRAHVEWTLGTRAGAGNNRVEASAATFAGVVTFGAVALAGTPNLIVVDAGNQQLGAVGEALPRAFVAVVTDAGSNRLGGVPVTFSVESGGGSFGGSPTYATTTDADGRAFAALVLGPTPGQDNNAVSATFAGNPGAVATFTASGRVPGDPAETRVSGVVLDNSDEPVPGVTVSLAHTDAEAQTDAQGQFSLPSPVGTVALEVDGSTATRPGVWPSLEFELVTIAGNNNQLDRPVYLLPIDIEHGIHVDESTGGTLTLPEVPGFSLTVAPGAATFPDDSKSGIVSVTVVHADKVPMTPGFGQQPRLIFTVQPPGVRFNPPARLSLPNVDGLRPGEVTELYSFDHDLGQFVAIGTGAVSEDGSNLVSDPETGLVKGGWHCGGNPATGQCLHQCPECQRCDGQCVCVADASGSSCDDGSPCTGPDACADGSCQAGPPLAGTLCGDDNTVCTLDVCDGSGECVGVGNLPTGSPCEDDHNHCTTDVCDGEPDTDLGGGIGNGQCIHNPVPSGSACTTDGTICTLEACDDGGGCIRVGNLPTGSPCEDDGDPCTEDECGGSPPFEGQPGDGDGICRHSVIPDCFCPLAQELRPRAAQADECPCSVTIASGNGQAALIGTPMAFLGQGTPAGGTMTWSGGGDPVSGSGLQFSTRFYAQGPHDVTATWRVDATGAQCSATARIEATCPIQHVETLIGGQRCGPFWGGEFSLCYPGAATWFYKEDNSIAVNPCGINLVQNFAAMPLDANGCWMDTVAFVSRPSRVCKLGTQQTVSIGPTLASVNACRYVNGGFVESDVDVDVSPPELTVQAWRGGKTYPACRSPL